MSQPKLDLIDWAILRALQADGRITNVELAAQVGLSAPPCLRRVRALENAGFIKGYHAAVDEKKLGFAVTVFAMVGLSSQHEDDLAAFEAHVRKHPAVRECYMLNGEVDFILKCVSKDLDEFQDFLTSALTPAPHVASVKTSFVIRQSKHSADLPLDQTLST